eukprot:SAG11_NODE_927_length_6519_cov_2.357788_4_plen_219_part_00
MDQKCSTRVDQKPFLSCNHETVSQLQDARALLCLRAVAHRSIGSEMSGGVRNITFEDSTSTGESGIRISSQPGRGGYVTDVTVRRVSFEWKSNAGKSFLFHINQQRICKPKSCSGGPHCGFACDNPNASIATPFSNLRFEDIAVRAPADFKVGDFSGGAIPIEGVVLKNISLSGPDVTRSGVPLSCVNVSGTSSDVTPAGVVCSQLQGASALLPSDEG